MQNINVDYKNKLYFLFFFFMKYNKWHQEYLPRHVEKFKCHFLMHYLRLQWSFLKKTLRTKTYLYTCVRPD